MLPRALRVERCCEILQDPNAQAVPVSPRCTALPWDRYRRM